MDFKSVSMQELFAYAKASGIAVPFAAKKAQVAAILTENGVTPEMVRGKKVAKIRAKKENQESDSAFDKTDFVLVKMTRRNSVFEFDGYKFTKDSPYVLMEPQKARSLFDSFEGFIQTTGNEVAEFYS